MSGAGRGIPRVGPVAGAPGPFVIPSEEINYRMFPVVPGPWGFVQRVSQDAQELTAAYVPFGQNGGTVFRIPYGSTRLGVVVNYLAASVGGQLGLQIQFNPADGYDLSTAIYVPVIVGDAAFAPTQDPRVAELDQYAQSVITPAGTTLTDQNYVLPFWVPPIIPQVNAINPDITPLVEFRVIVREASGISPEGQVNVLAIIGESFGSAFLFKGSLT